MRWSYCSTLPYNTPELKKCTYLRAVSPVNSKAKAEKPHLARRLGLPEHGNVSQALPRNRTRRNLPSQFLILTAPGSGNMASAYGLLRCFDVIRGWHGYPPVRDLEWVRQCSVFAALLVHTEEDLRIDSHGE
jgi:hypothetical protein